MKQCPCRACVLSGSDYQQLNFNDQFSEGQTSSSFDSEAGSSLCLNKGHGSRPESSKRMLQTGALKYYAKRCLFAGTALLIAALLGVAVRGYLRDDTATYREGARTHSASGRHEQAVALLNEGISKSANNVELYSELGLTYLNQGKYEDAREVLQKAVKLDQTHPTAQYGLGLYYIKVGNRRAVLDQHKILTRLDKEKANQLYSSLYE